MAVDVGHPNLKLLLFRDPYTLVRSPDRSVGAAWTPDPVGDRVLPVAVPELPRIPSERRRRGRAAPLPLLRQPEGTY